jgi:small-conductance mechanosensitive channel
MNAVPHWLSESNISFGAILATVFIFVAAAAIGTILNRYIQKLLDGIDRHLSISYETSLTITRSAAAAVWIVAAMLILNLWGISMSGLWTLLVSAAAVIGVGFLAVWAMISNITASLFLTIWRPFHLGQTVEVLPESLKGRVTGRNLMFTALSEDSGATLHVPNNLFFQKMFRVSGNASAFHTGHAESGQAKPGEATEEA